MAGQRGGLVLPLLLLSLAVPDLTLGTTTDVRVTVSPALPMSTPPGTTALVPTNTSTTAATTPPSSPQISTAEELTRAFTASAAMSQGSSPAASSITTPPARGSPALGTPALPASTTMQPNPTPTGLGLTSSTPTPTPMTATPNRAERTIWAAGTSTALAISSFGVERSTLPPTTSAPLSSTWVGTALGTSTRPGITVTMPLSSVSPRMGSPSSPAAPAPTTTSDELSDDLLATSTTPSGTTATPVTSTGVPGSTLAPSQPAGTTAGSIPGTSAPTAPETPSAAAGTTVTDVMATVSPTHPTSPTPMETSTLLLTSASTTASTSPPETEACTPERSSTSPGNGSTFFPARSPPTTPAPTSASAEPLTTPLDTRATPDTSVGVTGSIPTPGRLAGTMARTTPGISTPDTPTVSGTTTASMGVEPSSPAIDSAQTSVVTLSTPAELPAMLPVCPTAMSNTSASHLFLSLRLATPLDLGNTTVQELVLSKLRGDLQRAFPCAALALEWRGQRRT